MDTIEPTFMLFGDRPLLGAMALAACLAGGTGSHGAIRTDLAGAPHRIDSAGFAPGWERGAPAAPQAAVVALQSHLAVVQPVPHQKALARIHVSTAALPHITARAGISARPAAVRIDAIPMPLAPLPNAEPAALVARDVQPETLTTLAPAPAVPALQLPVTQDLAVVAAPIAPQVGAVPAVTLGPANTTSETQPLKIVSSPELRRFDLASFRAKPARPAASLAASRKPVAVGAKARHVDRLIDDVVFHHAAVSVGGKSGGDIAVRIGPDMKPSVKVADLLGLVSAQMDPDSLARFTQAGSAGEYVSFATLRSAGFDVSYNAAADSIAISAAP